MVLPQHLVVEHPQGPQVDQELVAHLEVVEALLQLLLLLLLPLLLPLSVKGGRATAAAVVAVSPPLLPLRRRCRRCRRCRRSSFLRCDLEPRCLLLDQRPEEGGLVLRLAQERGGLPLGQLSSSSDAAATVVVPPEEAGKRPAAPSAALLPSSDVPSAPDLSLFFLFCIKRGTRRR